MEQKNTKLRSAMRNARSSDKMTNPASTSVPNRLRTKSVEICPIILIRSYKNDGETSDSLDYLSLNKDTRRTYKYGGGRKIAERNAVQNSIVAIWSSLKFEHQAEQQYRQALQDAEDATIVIRRLFGGESSHEFLNPGVKIKPNLISALRRLERRAEREAKPVGRFREVDVHSLGITKFNKKRNNSKSPSVSSKASEPGDFNEIGFTKTDGGEHNELCSMDLLQATQLVNKAEQFAGYSESPHLFYYDIDSHQNQTHSSKSIQGSTIEYRSHGSSQ